MLFSVQQQARTTLYRLPFLELAPYVVLVLIWWVLTPSALWFAIELLHARPRLAKASTKSNTVRGHNCAPIFALSLVWEQELVPCSPSMASSTADACLMLFVVWTVMTYLMKFRKKKTSRRLPMGYLLDKLHKQDFAGPLSSGASRVLGPISRYRVADILLHMKLVSRASRPGLIAGFLCILCNELCTAQRFHAEEHDHTCRVGCLNEPDSLTHYIECHRLYNIFTSF